jgi:hypothetical protein
VLANYRFSLPDGGSVDVLWRMRGSEAVDFSLTAGLNATLITRDGATTPLGNLFSTRLDVSEQPVYLRQDTERIVSFAEIGHALRGRFLNYRERNGGLAVFGYPISPERVERRADGRDYVVQWFERNRFEYHPENAPPNDVLLGRLGVEFLEQRDLDWRLFPTVTGAAEDCLFFPETSHSLCPPFRAFWERNGGLAVFGYPISEPMQAQNEADGNSYLVQYFERNRFEYHPENSPPYDVQLGLLGSDLIITLR